MTVDYVVARPAVLNWLRVGDADRLRTALDSTDMEVVQLDGAQVSDERSLLAAFEALAGFSFAAGGWDALRDVLPEIVGRSPSARSCLLWDHVDNMLHGALPDLVTALLILADTSRDLAQHDRRFVTFLIGDGPNFR